MRFVQELDNGWAIEFSAEGDKIEVDLLGSEKEFEAGHKGRYPITSCWIHKEEFRRMEEILRNLS